MHYFRMRSTNLLCNSLFLLVNRARLAYEYTVFFVKTETIKINDLRDYIASHFFLKPPPCQNVVEFYLTTCNPSTTHPVGRCQVRPALSVVFCEVAA